MRTKLLSAAAACLLSGALLAQADLTIGFNYSYNPPSNCNNQITALEIDVCNNNSTAAGSFIVGIYLYKPSTQQYWVIDTKTMNSLSGNACVTISNWNINMNNYCCLPAPGTDYRIGVWVDTANAVTESNENNNASLLTGNIQVCASSNVGIREQAKLPDLFRLSPNPASGNLILNLESGAHHSASMTVIDGNGKLMKDLRNPFADSDQAEISTADLPEGVYLLRISTDMGTQTRKLIIAR